MPTVEQRALMSIASELKQIRKSMEDLSDNVKKTTSVMSDFFETYRQARKIVDEHESFKQFAENHREDDIHE